MIRRGAQAMYKQTWGLSLVCVVAGRPLVDDGSGSLEKLIVRIALEIPRHYVILLRLLGR